MSQPPFLPPHAPEPAGASNDPLKGLPSPFGFSGGNQVAVLQGGRQLFPAMIEAIAHARHEVWAASYIFEDNPSVTAVIDALCGAAQRGVQVRLLVDGFGCNATLPALSGRCLQAGVSLAVFRPLQGWWSWLQPIQLRRMHKKLCVVDDKVAFVGGINLIDDCFDQRHGWSEQPRLDFAVSLHGPIVGSVRSVVRALWTRAWLGNEFREEVSAMSQEAHPLGRLRRLIRRLRMPVRASAVRLATSHIPMRAAFIVRDNLRQRRTIERHYIAAIRQAQERIDLMSPYFYPGRAFRRALRQAASRGVKVRVVLQGKIDFPIAHLAARMLYDEMHAKGVQIFEYQPAFLHAKIALVDAHWATVGSSNIDPLSLLLNLEANVIVHDASFNAELACYFDAAVVNSREVGPRDSRYFWFRPWQQAAVAWCVRLYLRVAGRSGRY